MYETILLPTDGSEGTRQAVARGLDLAEKYDATLYVLSVIDANTAGFTVPTDINTEQVRQSLRKVAEQAVNNVVEQAEDRSIMITTEIRVEIPHEAILNYVDESEIDLIVMGTQGRTGVERYLVGSVAERVVRLSEIPVLTVRTTDIEYNDESYDSILIPTDGSPAAEAAIDHGLDIARTYDATIHTLSVIDVLAESGYYDPGNIPDDVLTELETQGKEDTQAIAEKAATMNLDAVPRVFTGNPSDTILEYTAAEDIDMVVMGTHGRTGLERYLIGSVTEKIMRHAECPVLTVSMSEEDEE